MTRLRIFAEANRGVLRHARFEGDLAEAVAHEISHFNSLRALGLRRHLAQPLWKSEGWAEYQANLAAIHADPGYDLHARIDQLLDDTGVSHSRGSAAAEGKSDFPGLTASPDAAAVPRRRR